MNEFLMTYFSQISEAIDSEFIAKFVVVYFFLIWISLVVWVLKDIRNRTMNVFYQIFCLMVGFIPFFGIFIYLILRPSRTLYEKYYEEIEENLDIINEIIEERKKQFENKINTTIEKEKKELKKSPILDFEKNKKDKKIKFSYKTEILKNEKTEKKEDGKSETKITQIKKKNF